MKKNYLLFFSLYQKQFKLIINDKELFYKLRKKIKIDKFNHKKKSNFVINIKLIKSHYKIFTKNMFSVEFRVKDKNIVNKIIWTVYFFIQKLLLNNKLLFFHASSIFLDNKGYLFLGSSGSGKTTIVNNFSKKNIINDDVSIIKKEKDFFYILSNPFEKDKKNFYFKKKFLLKKIFILNKGSFLKIKKINLEKDLIILLQNCLYSMFKLKSDKINPFFYKLLMDLLKKDIICNLQFPKKFDILKFQNLVQY